MSVEMSEAKRTYKVKKSNIVKLNKYYEMLVGSEDESQKKDIVNKNNK